VLFLFFSVSRAVGSLPVLDTGSRRFESFLTDFFYGVMVQWLAQVTFYHLISVQLRIALKNGLLAQLVEQRPFKAWVTGSNPVQFKKTWGSPIVAIWGDCKSLASAS
jgi:hypothetical protein